MSSLATSFVTPLFVRVPRAVLRARRSSPVAVEPEKKMKVVAAYLLAVLGGNAQPSAKDLKSILVSVGAETEDDRLELLLSEVKGKDLAELIAAGREKLASVPSGSGAAAAYSAPAAAGAAAAAAPAAAEAKEEKKEEKEESDDDMGFSLFD